MGKLTEVFKGFFGIFRGGKSRPRGFELSDEVKQEILSGLGQKPTDDLRLDGSKLDNKPGEEESDNSQ